MQIQFKSNNEGKPPLYGPITSTAVKKIADCELLFEEGPLVGHKLQGFVIWERIKPTETKKVGDISVTGPNWQFKSGVETVTCGLLRPIDDTGYGYGRVQDPLRAMILEAYKQWAKPKKGLAKRLLDKAVTL